MYQTFVIAYNPAADQMAAQIQAKANELQRDGYEVVGFSITNSAKAIILAKRDDVKEA